MFAEEAGHFWKEVGTPSLSKERFLNLSGAMILMNDATRIIISLKLLLELIFFRAFAS